MQLGPDPRRQRNVASLGEEPLFRLDVRVPTWGARRRYNRRAVRADVGRGLGDTGIDIGGWVDDAARAVELVAQGAARTAACAFVRLVWHRLLRLGARGVGLGIPAHGRWR